MSKAESLVPAKLKLSPEVQNAVQLSRELNGLITTSASIPSEYHVFVDARINQLRAQIAPFANDKAFQAELERERVLEELAQGALELDKRLFGNRVEYAKFNNPNLASIASYQQTKLNQERDELQEKRAKILTSGEDGEVFDYYKRAVLADYHRQLIESNHYVKFPSRQEMIIKIIELWSAGLPVMLYGETGTGKTELMKEAGRLVDTNGQTPFVLKGKPTLMPEDFEGDTGLNEGSTVYVASPLMQSLVDPDGPLVIIYDEANVAPNSTNMALKELLNLKAGSQIRVLSDDETTVVTKTVQQHYIGATQNPAGRYDREKATAELSRTWNHEELDYPRPGELYNLILSAMSDSTGGIPLSWEDAATTLKNLCLATEEVQRLFTGKQRTESGGIISQPPELERMIFEQGKILAILHLWKGQSSEESFEHFLSKAIGKELVDNGNFSEQERLAVLKAFVLKGFFAGFKPEDFRNFSNNKSDSDLAKALGPVANRPIQGHDGGYLYAEDVAQLDPFGYWSRMQEELGLQAVTIGTRELLTRPAAQPAFTRRQAGGTQTTETMRSRPNLQISTREQSMLGLIDAARQEIDAIKLYQGGLWFHSNKTVVKEVNKQEAQIAKAVTALERTMQQAPDHPTVDYWILVLDLFNKLYEKTGGNTKTADSRSVIHEQVVGDRVKTSVRRGYPEIPDTVKGLLYDHFPVVTNTTDLEKLWDKLIKIEQRGYLRDPFVKELIKILKDNSDPRYAAFKRWFIDHKNSPEFTVLSGYDADKLKELVRDLKL